MSARAIDIFDDSDRTLLASDLVRLEVLPKAVFHGQTAEVDMYERFFNERVDELATITDSLIQEALNLAVRWNLNAVDALHVATAIQLQANELVTTERPTSPLSRVAEPGLTIISIREGSSQE